jgi:hypothetical protein
MSGMIIPDVTLIAVNNGWKACDTQKRKIGESEEQHQVPDKESRGDATVPV